MSYAIFRRILWNFEIPLLFTIPPYWMPLTISHQDQNHQMHSKSTGLPHSCCHPPPHALHSLHHPCCLQLPQGCVHWCKFHRHFYHHHFLPTFLYTTGLNTPPEKNKIFPSFCFCNFLDPPSPINCQHLPDPPSPPSLSFVSFYPNPLSHYQPLKSNKNTLQCTMCSLGSMFTSQPNKLRHI